MLKQASRPSSNLTEAFQSFGWAVAPIFDAQDLDAFIDTLHDVVRMQMRKLRLESTGKIDDDVIRLNGKSSTALNECLQMVRNTSIGHRLASSTKLNDLAAQFLHDDKDLHKRLLISGPSFFINIPDTNERKYTWHSEQNWYPKRRNFLNVWCPIIHHRTNKDSMGVMSGSHAKDWFYFSEYSGYDGTFDDKANVQYEIPESFLTDYKPETPSVKIGEGLFFNGRLVHRSLDNKASHPLYTIVFRAFDYSEDLTLSSNWADIPYNRKSMGYPEINVKP
ncbi:MAG TPA: phytanoyl-CoA dioxygenase family protein [Alphaproteobacteria bacterium]|nr:phytanoyl-CoA dioxygenase family protein [Alphaproteobacteria bacterium]